MGGSSLAPLVFADSFGKRPGYPVLEVLDPTDPSSILAVERRTALSRSLFVVSSKSGSTLEPNVFFDYFYGQVEKALGARAGERFVVVTDPGSPLEKEAAKRRVRRVFPGDPDIGGRYSALSHFRLVPAALPGGGVAQMLRPGPPARRLRPRGPPPRRSRGSGCRRDAAAGPRDDGPLPQGGGGEPGPPARSGDRRGRRRGTRQADLLRRAAGSPIRDVDRAVDRREHGQGRARNPARRGRASGRAGGLRLRPLFRRDRAQGRFRVAGPDGRELRDAGSARPGRRDVPLGVRDGGRGKDPRDQPLRPAQRPGGEGSDQRDSEGTVDGRQPGQVDSRQSTVDSGRRRG